MAISDFDFRRTMGSFATGVTVVTTLGSQGNFQGITVNSFTSVSLSPRLVSICIDKRTEAHQILVLAGLFCVNILNEQQQYLSDRFAGREPLNLLPFDDIPVKTVATGAPVFVESLGFADCRVVNMVDAGDHTIFIGEVLALGHLEGVGPAIQSSQPLLYYRSDYRQIQT